MKKTGITMMRLDDWAAKEINKFQAENFVHWVKDPQKQVSHDIFSDLKKQFENENGLRAVCSMGEERFMEGSGDVNVFLSFCMTRHGLQPGDAISSDDFRSLVEEFVQRGDFSPFIEGIEGQGVFCWSFLKNFIIFNRCIQYNQ